MRRSKLHHNIYIVTGKVHSGKTTFVRELTGQLKKNNIHMAGFLSVGSFRKGKRDSFSLVNIGDGKKQALATIEKREGWVQFRRFFLSPEALLAGERIIRMGLEQGTDLVVLDEVGPLELEGGGWAGILKDLLKEYEMAQIWVVREQVVDQVLVQWNIPETNVFRANPGEIENIFQTILRHVHYDESSPAA